MPIEAPGMEAYDALKRGLLVLVLFLTRTSEPQSGAPPSSFRPKVLGAHASCVLLPREKPNPVDRGYD